MEISQFSDLTISPRAAILIRLLLARELITKSWKYVLHHAMRFELTLDAVYLFRGCCKLSPKELMFFTAATLFFDSGHKDVT